MLINNKVESIKRKISLFKDKNLFFNYSINTTNTQNTIKDISHNQPFSIYNLNHLIENKEETNKIQKVQERLRIIDYQLYNKSINTAKNKEIQYKNLYDSHFIIGMNIKFPIQNEFLGKYFNKEIRLMSYSYPAYYNPCSYDINIKKPVGVIFFLHGIYEHIDSLAYIGKIYSSYGYDVYGIDLQGHGRSEGSRGLMDSKEGVINNYILYIDKVINDNKDYKTIPKYILGYSFGGVMSGIIILKREIFSGCIIISGPMTTKFIPQKLNFLYKYLKFMNIFKDLHVPMLFSYKNSFIYKIYKFILSTLLNRKKIVPPKQQALFKFYNEDKLRYSGRHKIGTALTIKDLFEESEESIPNIKIPLLIIHGKEDRLCPLESIKEYLKKLKCEYVFIEVDGAGHDLPHDSSIKELIEVSLDWMNEKNKLYFNKNI